MNSDKTGKVKFPSRKQLESSIQIIEGFRDLCKHQLNLGYWATVDFPSKHHINCILQLQYRNKTDLVNEYGTGLTEHALKMVATCKAYVLFIRDDSDEKMENTAKGNTQTNRQNDSRKRESRAT